MNKSNTDLLLPRDTSRLLSDCIEHTIHIGAPLYNEEKIRECYDVYMDAARYVLDSSLTIQRSPIGKRLEAAVDEATQVVRQAFIAGEGGAEEAHDEGAWILRRCFDAILEEMGGAVQDSSSSPSPSPSLTKSKQEDSSGIPTAPTTPETSPTTSARSLLKTSGVPSVLLVPRDAMESFERSGNITNTKNDRRDDYGVGVDYSRANFSLAQDDDDSASFAQNETGKVIANLATSMEQTVIDIRDRKHNFKTYTDCFVGREAVDQIVRMTGTGRPQAIALLSKLARYGLIHHVTHGHIFKDKYLFYRFTSMQDIKKAINSMSLALPVEPALDGDDEEMIRFTALVHRYKHLTSLDDKVESVINKISYGGSSKRLGGDRGVTNQTPVWRDDSTLASAFNEDFSVLYPYPENAGKEFAV